jgi:hypothetical protein
MDELNGSKCGAHGVHPPSESTSGTVERHGHGDSRGEERPVECRPAILPMKQHGLPSRAPSLDRVLAHRDLGAPKSARAAMDEQDAALGHCALHYDAMRVLVLSPTHARPEYLRRALMD